MREIVSELKALKLYGMAGAWGDLATSGQQPQLSWMPCASGWCGKVRFPERELAREFPGQPIGLLHKPTASRAAFAILLGRT